MEGMKRIRIMSTAGRIAFAVAIATLFSCAKGDLWRPGPEVDPDSPRAFFGEPVAGWIEDGGDYLDVAVKRVNKSGRVTVPIAVTASAEELSFPAGNVVFEEGEETAAFRVTLNEDAEYERNYPFELKIDEAYADPYTALGTPVYKGSVRLVEPWTHIATMDCTFEARSGANRPQFLPFEQQLYKKAISGLFRIEDWCLNGTREWYGDLIFTVDENKQIHPSPEIGFHSGNNRWYFYTPDATSIDSRFQLNGHLPTEQNVYMTWFYLYTVGSSDSRYSMDFDEEARTAKLGGYSRYSSNLFSHGSFVLHYRW